MSNIEVRELKQQSKIFREMADLLDKAVIAIENGEDDKVEEIEGACLIKIMQLKSIEIKGE
ncbi:hypothetical protein HMPREF1092_00902 [Clostridium thermobutyricum]|uniref:Uncharacterized protein n=1 Tax=Clostridium thermobutyricum TaxID=29372 RepID=N9XPP7_9CLOT|nr:hypothetical protein [Clostridium thermobutyricum]ENZ01668.1 hypothetical protein HMPREF1092_00902 [Clostridium thermobutyricum]